MPIYAFRCPTCDHEFEELVFGGRVPERCPACGARDIVRKVSTFATAAGSGSATPSSHSCGGSSHFS